MVRGTEVRSRKTEVFSGLTIHAQKLMTACIKPAGIPLRSCHRLYPDQQFRVLLNSRNKRGVNIVLFD